MSSTLPSKSDSRSLLRFHLQFGWWSLVLFLLLGAALELLLGYEVASYAGAENETRRLMWRLAHVHGTLISFIHLAFGFTLLLAPQAGERGSATSKCLLGSSFLVPLGFFAAGIQFFDGDPGWAIFVVPIGAVLLLVAVVRIARSLRGTIGSQ